MKDRGARRRAEGAWRAVFELREEVARLRGEVELLNERQGFVEAVAFDHDSLEPPDIPDIP